MLNGIKNHSNKQQSYDLFKKTLLKYQFELVLYLEDKNKNTAQ